MELSAYKIYWTEFFPCSGKYVTKKDIYAIEGSRYFGTGIKNKTYRKFFSSKEHAVSFLQNFDKPLTKKYKVLLFTDKQLAMAKEENNYAIPYTKKQLEEVYYIGK